MATRDFRSQQLRTTQIIASGSDTTSKPSLLIYSSSAAANDQGGLNPALLSGAGEDNWLFISGSTQSTDGEQVLFGGNIAVSGSVTGSHFTSLPGQSLVLTADKNMRFRIDTDDATDGISEGATFSFENPAGDEIADIDEQGNMEILGDLDVGGGDVTIKAGQDTSAHLFMKADAGDDAGDEWRLKASGTDTFSIGNDKASAGSYVDIVTVTGNATATSTNVATAGTLQVGGNIIKAADGGNTITMDNNDNVQIAGDLRVDGNHPTGASVIRNSQNEAVITINQDQDTFLSGTLTIPSSIIHDGDSDTLITFDTNEVVIQSGAAKTTEFGSARVSINKDYQDQDVEIRGDTTNTRIFHTIASQDSVKFLHANDSDIAEHDVNFKVHGIAGNKNTVGTRGTALFVGDVVVSGTLYAEKQVVEENHSQVGNLVLTGAIHLDDSGAAYGSTLPVPAGDGAIYVSTGSLYAKLAEHPGGATTEVLIGQNYLAGNGIESYIVNPNTTFQLDVAALTGSLTSSAGEGSWSGFEKPESHGAGMLFHEDVFAVGSKERFDGRYMLFNKAGATATTSTNNSPTAGTDAAFLTTEGFGYIQPYQNNFYSLDDGDGASVRFVKISTLDGPGHGTAGTPDADNEVYVYLQIETTGFDPAEGGSSDKFQIYGLTAAGLTVAFPTAASNNVSLDWTIDILDVHSYGAEWRQVATISDTGTAQVTAAQLDAAVTGELNGVKRWIRAKCETASESITTLKGFFFYAVSLEGGELIKVANPIVVFESKRETKKIAMQDFLSQSAGPGILNAGRLSYQTDNRIVAHLTGSEFSGPVGVTGSFGVDGDISLDSGHILYLNGRGGDVFIQGTADTLLIDVDDTLDIKADAIALADPPAP